MRTLFWTCALTLFLASSVAAQDLEQLRKTIQDNIPATIPDDLGRNPSPPELLSACKAVVDAASKIYALPNLDEAARHWTQQREAIALIILAYAETPTYYPRLAVASDELGKRGNKNTFKESEKHALRIGSVLATAERQVGNLGVDIGSLAERMVSYAQQFPGMESMQLIDQLLFQVRSMKSAAQRDRRLAVIAPICQKYYQSINHTPRAKALDTDIARSTLPGNPIQLMGVDINGRDLDLNALRDKVVLLHFWGTWCVHCKEDVPLLISLYEKYHKSGFEIIGINTAVQGDDERKVRRFLDGMTFGGKKIPWTILHEGLGERKHGTSITKLYGIDELPVMILIGRNGKVLNLHPSAGMLDELIENATSLLASIEFTEEEKRIIEENRRKQNEEIDRQIRSELSSP
jgi:thiol-disulfide isomerase/thioredoxin